MEPSLLHRLALALAIGLIVGIERGWKSRAEHGGLRMAGVRTFTLVGLFGGAIAALAEPNPVVGLAAGLVGLAALVVSGYLQSARATQDYGITTEVALMITYALGAGAVLGYPFEAAAGAIVMSLVLGFKTEVHRAVERLERHEILATLQLLLIAAVLVPLLPDRELGPLEALNPRTVGMLVLLIAGMSYVGYFAVRVFGSRLGVVLTAIFGGLSSSTAVTVAYARRSRAAPSHAKLFGAGIALAAAVMTPRLAAEIAIVNVSILADLWPTFLVLALAPLLFVARAVFARTPAPPEAVLKLANPLQLRTALIFGALLGALFVAAAALQAHVGAAGLYAGAALAGLIDVDAIGLALARGAGRGIDAVTAERAIVLALLANTGSKAVLAAALGGGPMLRSVSVTLGVALAAAGLTAALTLR
jgi:uncharacterized membrane protein (DUF4010 family)